MMVDAIQAATVYASVQSSRLERACDASALMPAPANILAMPIETARAEVNQAALFPALMAPTRDGIYTIGAVAVRASSATRPITPCSRSSWGF